MQDLKQKVKEVLAQLEPSLKKDGYKMAKDVAEIIKELTAREEKLMHTLKEVVSLVECCCNCIKSSSNDELKTALKELGLE